MTEKPYFERYKNPGTHWFRCRCCGGVSWDSDSVALAGMPDLSPGDVVHDRFCPGVSFPDKYVRRITRTF